MVDIEGIVLQDLQEVTRFAKEQQQEFLDTIQKRSEREIAKLQADNNAELDRTTRRINEIDEIIQKLYEDNVSGKISDERFGTMTSAYEKEQSELKEKAKLLKKEISVVRDEGESVGRFMKLVNKYSEITELNAEIIRSFIEKIYVYEAEEIDGVRTQKIKIIYNCVGAVKVPNTLTVPIKTKNIEVA